MRWCYKTIHYELKKEGFLGRAFLDEAEVEQSLNEYGQAGWELVSIMETQDGLIAIFKQPLDPVAQINSAPEESGLLVGEKIDDDLITEDDIIEETHEEKPSDDDDLNSIRIE